MRTKSLTQKELVSFMQRSGFTDVTLRRITDWRENHLLPKFDDSGRGLGKGKGKESSQWSNKKQVISQAIWVYKLLKYYRSFDDLYLPLWTLGYPIPLEIVREELQYPLEFFNQDIHNEALASVNDEELLKRNVGFIEDYLGDVVFNISRKDNFSKMFSLPQNIGEALLNICVNPEYQLGDLRIEFEEEFLSLHKHKQEMEATFLTVFELSPETLETPKPSANELNLEFILHNAPFIQQHFSATQLQKAVENASDDDLRQVQIDMGILWQMVQGIGDGISILMQDLPFDFENDQLKGLTQMLVSSSKLLIWMDVSLRNNGYAEIINQIRLKVLQKVEETFNNKETRQTLADASSTYAQAFETMLDTLKRGLEKLTTEKQLILMHQ